MQTRALVSVPASPDLEVETAVHLVLLSPEHPRQSISHLIIIRKKLIALTI